MPVEREIPTLTKGLEAIASDTTNAHSKLIAKVLDFSAQSADGMMQGAVDFVMVTFAKILLALAIWFCGRWLIKKYKNFISRVLVRRKVDAALSTFLLNLLSVVLTVALVVFIIGLLGFKTTTFVALFASAGVGLGLALSGTLQNFAGGAMILLSKTYKIGDYITVQDCSGTVKDIRLFHTVLVTPENRTILVPNGAISSGTIDNYTAAKKRRLEWTIDISYGDDFELAKKVVSEILNNEKRIIKNEEQLVAIKELGASSVKIVVRAWCKTDDFWDVFFDINERVYKLLPERGLNFPYPQLDVRVLK